MRVYSEINCRKIIKELLGFDNGLIQCYEWIKNRIQEVEQYPKGPHFCALHIERLRLCPNF